MIGTIVNTVAVLIGASIGLLLKKGIPARISDGIMKALGLSTVFLGISGSLKGNNSLILIISMVNTGLLQSTIKPQSDTAEWIYFMQNSTQWKNEDFDTSDTSYA